MNPVLIILISIIGLTLIFEITKIIYAQILINKLSAMIMQNRINEFYTHLSLKTTTFFIPKFNLNYLKLNAAFMENNTSKISQCLDVFEQMKLKEKQKESVYVNAFSFYLQKNNYPGAKRCYNHILNLSNEALKSDITIIYEIQFEKSSQYIDDFIARLAHASNEEKSTLEGMIAKMYENCGNKVKAKEYREKAKNTYLKHNA